jgi:uracil-DNA glycosylase
MTWKDIQLSIRTCRQCENLDGRLFASFHGGWPEIPEPRRRSILFVSEAPPQDGGFWTIQGVTGKQDDLREKLLPLLNLTTNGPDRGLGSFRDAGYFLLQSFPRPLQGSVGNIKMGDLGRLLRHPVETHLKDQIDFLSPVAVLALGRPASAALSMLFPGSSFARSFESGDIASVQGRIFQDQNQPLLSATYLQATDGSGGAFGKATCLCSSLRPITEMSNDLMRTQMPEEKELAKKASVICVAILTERARSSLRARG